MRDVIFLGNARCYHTMDWYRNAQDVCYPKRVMFATDLIASEGHVKLVSENDDIIHLYNIDWLLLRNQSKFGNLWRNFVKFILLPLQVVRLRKIATNSPKAIYHAHTMYYMLLGRLAGVSFIGTPQGSEILVRPDRSRVYKYFARKSLLAAKHITVDSAKMQYKILQLCGAKSYIVQNGIDINAISHVVNNPTARVKIVSIRAITPLYRIDEICKALINSQQKPPLTFFYPFWEDEYKTQVFEKLGSEDLDL